MRRLLFLFATLSAPCAHGKANPNQPLDRPFTLLDRVPFLLERELGRQTRGEGPMSFIFPRPCVSPIDSSVVCEAPSGFRHGHPDSGASLAATPRAGYEFRILEETIHATEVGAIFTGHTGPASFYLDVRMYTEIHEQFHHDSYDREFVETQDAGTTGSFAYSSYSRYRANLSWDLRWGRITVGRDAAHWGPGLYNNLVFHRDAVPFNQATFTAHIGPLSVQSLYGQLIGVGDRLFDTEPESRSVFAHRYELRPLPALLLGVSEQLFLYAYEEPFAFAPVIPLFIFKGDTWERVNNGNISADLCWRILPSFRIYTEFLIDDIQSPSSLFSNRWSEKWAWMAGFQWAGVSRGIPIGAVLEYARVEPWVYTHYVPSTAQAENQGHPLGHPLGPNSQRVSAAVFLDFPFRLHAGLHGELRWKGKDLGSNIEDVAPDGLQRKAFLVGVEGPQVEIRPEATLVRGPLSLRLSLALGAGTRALAYIQAQY